MDSSCSQEYDLSCSGRKVIAKNGSKKNRIAVNMIISISRLIDADLKRGEQKTPPSAGEFSLSRRTGFFY
jgi:hypothetical protein